MPCGPRDKFSTTTRSHDSTKFSRPWDDDLFDYCCTRLMDGTCSLFFTSIWRRLIRPLRYSTSEWDMLPNSLEDLRMRHTLYFPRGFFLSPTRRRIIRLLQYSTYGWDKFPIPPNNSIAHEISINRLLRYSIWKERTSQDELQHKTINQEKFFQRELANSLTKKSYPHSKEKIQYILLIYQLYNLVGHRLRLLYKLDKLVMVTSRTHAIAKDTYLSPRPVWLDKTKSLRYTIPWSISKYLENFWGTFCSRSAKLPSDSSADPTRTRPQSEPPPEVPSTPSDSSQYHLSIQQEEHQHLCNPKENSSTKETQEATSILLNHFLQHFDFLLEGGVIFLQGSIFRL